jgi:predicted glycoside hydrolase/deacetylase ChbG (UPF0249 family)
VEEVPLKVILNADDLGYSAEVNHKIFALIDRGRVTSATLLANGPAIDAATSEARRYPQASFGLHLNITEFSPLTDSFDLAPLLNQRGEFSSVAHQIKYSSALRRAIFEEWCAQIRRLTELGIQVSHIDSHHHVHTIPQLFSVLKRVQMKFAIRKVRLTRNVFDRREKLRVGLVPAKAVWNFALRNVYQTTTTDSFTSFETFHSRLATGQSWKGCIELMTHPGGTESLGETHLLSTAWESLSSETVKLINYNEL